MKKNINIQYIVNDADINEMSLIATAQYAKKFNAHINFLRIYDSYKSMSSFFQIPAPTMREKLLENLEKTADKLKPLLGGLSYSCHVREGILFIEAIHEMRKNKSELIVLTKPNADKTAFTSNAMHIIRKSPIPVWLIRSTLPPGKRKILVAIDIDINDKVKKNVNEKCMSLAKKLVDSSTEPCELVIAHCWSLANEKYLREIASDITTHQIDEMSDRQRMFHEEWFNAFIKKHHDSNLTGAYFIKGNPEEEIHDLIKDEKIDLLIMGTVNNIQTPGLYISSRAETILDATSTCSVLTVKPDGFVSPIQ